MRFTRRRLLQSAVACAAGGALYWGTRDKIGLGLIGCGLRGRHLAMWVLKSSFHRLAGDVRALCDVYRPHAEKVKGKYAHFADIHEHYRDVLARDDIQAVIIATPDHWHVPIALEAIQAGKAVYCEKPLTHTVREGQVLRDAVVRSGITFQVGTQQRSSTPFQTACELVRNGRLGDIRKITVTVPPGETGGPFASQPVPEGLNWDLWLGPANWAEYCPERMDHFRAWYEYSGGRIGDWGAHHLDIVQWALNLEHSGPLTVHGHAQMPAIPGGYTVPGTFTVDYEYPRGVQVQVKTDLKQQAILFEGTRGEIFVNRGKVTGRPFDELKSNPLPPEAVHLGGRNGFWDNEVVRHLQNFYHCIRTGETPASSVATQHRSATVCHLGNISMRLGRKLAWNASAESFVDDPAADALLSREHRDAYPAQDELILASGFTPRRS